MAKCFVILQVVIVAINGQNWHSNAVNNIYYFSGSTTKTYADAQQDCENLDSQLVTINHEGEQMFLLDVYEPSPPATMNHGHWVGLFCENQQNGDSTWCNDNSNYEWLSGEASSFRSWTGGEPFVLSLPAAVSVALDTGGWTADPPGNSKRYICERLNPCYHPGNPCLNRGTCSLDLENGFGEYTCICTNGFTGTHCEEYNGCDSNPCVRGTCNNNEGSFSCSCPSGYTGVTCEFDIDECITDEHNCIIDHGFCVNIRGDFSCVCHDGYTGIACETDIDLCASGPCLNGGTCNDHLNGYSCTCTEFYTSNNCEMDINECNTQRVCNNGSCENSNGGFNCYCYDGYTGSRCATDIDECEAILCLNGATCENTEGSFLCYCVAGYTGIYCEENVSECASNPCANNGTCDEQINGYECQCTQYFTGTHCDADIDECAVVGYCGDGQCTNTVGGFDCMCPQGFTGDVCSEDINECLDDDMCGSEGKCINHIGTFSCVCNSGNHGKYCQEKHKQKHHDFQDSFSAKALLAATALLLSLLLSCTIYICACKQRNNVPPRCTIDSNTEVQNTCRESNYTCTNEVNLELESQEYRKPSDCQADDPYDYLSTDEPKEANVQVAGAQANLYTTTHSPAATEKSDQLDPDHPYDNLKLSMNK